MGKPTQPTTKERLLQAGERLFRTRGFAGTGLKRLAQEADAPWGSMYHFFPEGKDQLGAEVVAYAAQLYRAGWVTAFARIRDPGEAVEGAFRAEARLLKNSDYRDGCPVASMTLDIASVSEPLRAACDAGFAVWRDAICEGLMASGAPEAEATALSVFILSAIEGAIVLARAAKSETPLLQSAVFVRQAVDIAAANWVAPD
jgi:TetR/AcrR family transcriptional regulator, lmrAB and yxaGH operons repressor